MLTNNASKRVVQKRHHLKDPGAIQTMCIQRYHQIRMKERGTPNFSVTSRGSFGVSLALSYPSLLLVILKQMNKLRVLKAQFVKDLHAKAHSHVEKRLNNMLTRLTRDQEPNLKENSFQEEEHDETLTSLEEEPQSNEEDKGIKDTQALQDPMTRGRLKRLQGEVFQKIGMLKSLKDSSPSPNPSQSPSPTIYFAIMYIFGPFGGFLILAFDPGGGLANHTRDFPFKGFQVSIKQNLWTCSPKEGGDDVSLPKEEEKEELEAKEEYTKEVMPYLGLRGLLTKKKMRSVQRELEDKMINLSSPNMKEDLLLFSLSCFEKLDIS
ncbi:hypothetical protein CR513_18666, partial [Mucuna pruriens]